MNNNIGTNEFFQAINKPEEKINIRIFSDRGDPDFKGQNYSLSLSKINEVNPALKEHNEKNRGIYFVVNTGGNTDAEVLEKGRVTAQFFECDNGTFEEQWEKINNFPISPSIVVKTRKSLHVYYLIKDGDMKRFRNIQQRFANALGADAACVNESRVLRVPGFYHCKEDPLMVECVLFEPERVYTQDEIAQHLPELTIVSKSTINSGVADGQNPGLEIACHKCLFLQHCKENPNELNEHDWYAMITNLVTFKGGRERAHEYSAPYPKYSHRETEAKIDHFFESGTGPIKCNTISEKGWKCPNLGKCSVNAPAGFGYYKLITEELKILLSRIQVPSDPVETVDTGIRFIQQFLLNNDYIISETFVTEYLGPYLGLPKKKARQLAKQYINIRSQKTDIADDNLKQLLKNHKSTGGKNDFSGEANIIIKWFIRNEGFFYNLSEGSFLIPALYYKGKLLPIGVGDRNLAFTSRLNEVSDIISTTVEGKAVIQVIKEYCHLNGHPICDLTWNYLDKNNNTIYLSILPAESILKLSIREVAIIKNGDNDEKVYLSKSSINMRHIELKPKVELVEGLKRLKEEFGDNLTCSIPNKIFIICLFIAIFLKGYSQIRPITKFSGNSNSGKTTAAKLITVLIYGHTDIRQSSPAAMFSSGSKSPVLVLDNLESENISRAYSEFLLTGATGITKAKRTSGTESGVTEEKVDCMVIVTAIEPFDKPELINRTFDIEFSTDYKKDNFIEDDAIERLIKNRDYILSSVFNLIAYHVLPNINELRNEAFGILTRAAHTKNRCNEYLSLMVSVLAVFTEVYPDLLYGMKIYDVVNAWLDYNDEVSESTERETSQCSYIIETVWEILRTNDPIQSICQTTGLKLLKINGIIAGFEFQTRQLFNAAAIIYKNRGLKFPFRSVKQLGERIKNDREMLRKQGWDYEYVGIKSGYKIHSFKSQYFDA